MKRPGTVILAFISLIALPFCLVGMTLLKTAVQAPSSSSPGSVFLIGMFGLVTTLVGAGLVAAATYGARKAKLASRLQAENPAEPWKWRSDWAQGRCDSRTRSDMIQAWIFATLWSLISAPILFFVPQMVQKRHLAAIAFIFPVIGLCLFVWAVRETLAWFEFGKTWFELAGTPGVIGREVRGNIHARFPAIPDHGIRLKLSCINRIVTGSGQNRSVNEKILWRDEKQVLSGEIYPGPIGVLIPVAFHIPWNAMQTDGRNPGNSIYWLLEADADVPGVNYKDLFELPVFRTKETPEEPQVEIAGSEPSSAPPAHMSVLITPTANGTEFYFPAGRNPKFACGLSAFVLLWSSFIALMIYLHTPFIFPAVFVAFDLILGYGALQLWFGTSRVIIESSRIRVKIGFLNGGKWQEFSKSQVLDIQSVITSQQGGSTGTPYYDIHLLQTEHKNLTIGQTIRNKEEALWIVSEMKRALGGRAAAAVAGK